MSNSLGEIMKTDREILEVAASKSGTDLSAISKKYDCDWMDIWNPLENRINAFDLMVKMELLTNNRLEFDEAIEKYPDDIMRAVVMASENC